MDHQQAKKVAERFVRCVETNDPDGIFAEDVFADVRTTQIYTQVLNRGGLGVRSPLDRIGPHEGGQPLLRGPRRPRNPSGRRW